MKKFNIFLLIVFLILVSFVIYFLAGGTLGTDIYSLTAPAADHPEALTSILNILNSGSAPQQFAQTPADATGCMLVDTTITLTDRGLFAAEWIDVTVEPAAGDIAVYSLTGEGISIAPGGSGQLNLKLITTAHGNTARTFTIRYYIYGMLRTVSVTG